MAPDRLRQWRHRPLFSDHLGSLYPTAYITRLARSATLDSLGSDYIITARAKGASKSRILFGHVMKNSLAPTITYAGPMFASIITGSFGR
jgi:oligopeptide transport system permease protein